MAPDSPPSVMYASTNAAATTIAVHRGQPSRARMTSARAYRFTPAMSTCAAANVIALSRWVGRLKRSRRYSGTLRTLEP